MPFQLVINHQGIHRRMGNEFRYTTQATFNHQHSTNIICVSRMPTGQIQPSNGGVATDLSQQINTTNGCTTHVLIPTLTLRIVLGDNTTFRTNYISHHKRTFTTFFTTQLMHNTCARTDTTFRTNYISPHKRTFTTFLPRNTCTTHVLVATPTNGSRSSTRRTHACTHQSTMNTSDDENILIHATNDPSQQTNTAKCTPVYPLLKCNHGTKSMKTIRNGNATVSMGQFTVSSTKDDENDLRRAIQQPQRIE
eukprot:1090261_1